MMVGVDIVHSVVSALRPRGVQDVQALSRIPMNEKVRGYVRSFRVVELQQVLFKLGLSRTGRKAELVDRLNNYANAATGGALPNG